MKGMNKILFFDKDYNEIINRGIITLIIPNNSQYSYHYWIILKFNKDRTIGCYLI